MPLVNTGNYMLLLSEDERKINEEVFHKGNKEYLRRILQEEAAAEDSQILWEIFIVIVHLICLLLFADNPVLLDLVDMLAVYLSNT
jgi:hypothetical protein